jgi:hypothetical protein
MRLSSLSLAAAVLGVAAVSACATTSPLHRSAPAPVIHTFVEELLESQGYTCEPSPDRSSFACTHPEVTDISFAYLPASNLLQMWASFSRNDDGLAAKWRTESCDDVHQDVGSINDELVIKLVCTPKLLRFEIVTWVPDAGLGADDVTGLVNVFSTVIGETIRARLLAPAETPAAAAPTAAPTAL